MNNKKNKDNKDNKDNEDNEDNDYDHGYEIELILSGATIATNSQICLINLNNIKNKYTIINK